ncbi:MAG TPA: sugar phosphate nucleotidyltransferase, partial [Patescibacteria group bacterium]|nr:sugar phosphate nucleotidyltransferase [Patescibacteria group bacterium]
FAKKVPDPERSGVVKFDETGKVLQIVEKPKEWISDYAIPGIYIYDNAVIEVTKSLKTSGRGELEIVDLHNYYLNKGNLNVTVLDGVWMDAGTFDSLLETSQIVKEKGLSKNFHPIVNEAIEQFNIDLKNRAKATLNAHNLILRK